MGKVASASITAGPSAGYQRSFAYDTLTRPVQATVSVSGTNYGFAATYDAMSRLSSVTYPSGLLLNYTYTSLGYAQQIVGPGGLAYWTANARGAELRQTQETAGNGVVTTQSFDAQTGRLVDILAGAGNIVQNFSYTYDVLGNVRAPLLAIHPDARHCGLCSTFPVLLNDRRCARICSSLSVSRQLPTTASSSGSAESCSRAA